MSKEKEDTQIIDLDKILWDRIKEEIGKSTNVDPNLTMSGIVYSIIRFIQETYN